MSRISILLVLAVCFTAAAQAPELPLDDTRFSVHTLIREDVFAGVLDNDLSRLEKGEKSIDILLQKRPADKASVLAWKASTTMYRAVRAREAGRTEEFQAKYGQALDLLAEAKKLGPDDFGVTAATAGMYAMLADRLPEKERGAAWASAYDYYLALWKVQARVIEQLPAHLQGELLGGLAQSSQRTGRAKELGEYLDKIVSVMPGTKYAEVAKEWKDNPTSAGEKRITCLSCHGPGRLAARRAALGDK